MGEPDETGQTAGPFGEKIAEVRLPKLAVNVVAVPLAVAIGVGFTFVAMSLPHAVAVAPRDAWLYVVYVIVVAVVHEAMHAFATVRWGKAPVRAIKFGFNWKGLMPYCHCRVPMEMRAYRVTSLFPLFVTGPVAVLVMLAYPAFWTAAAAAVTLVACVGDVWAYLKLRRFDKGLLVLDHPTEPGCDVYRPAKTPTGERDEEQAG